MQLPNFNGARNELGKQHAKPNYSSGYYTVWPYPASPERGLLRTPTASSSKISGFGDYKRPPDGCHNLLRVTTYGVAHCNQQMTQHFVYGNQSLASFFGSADCKQLPTPGFSAFAGGFTTLHTYKPFQLYTSCSTHYTGLGICAT